MLSVTFTAQIKAACTESRSMLPVPREPGEARRAPGSRLLLPCPHQASSPAQLSPPCCPGQAPAHAPRVSLHNTVIMTSCSIHPPFLALPLSLLNGLLLRLSLRSHLKGTNLAQVSAASPSPTAASSAPSGADFYHLPHSMSLSTLGLTSSNKDRAVARRALLHS